MVKLSKSKVILMRRIISSVAMLMALAILAMMLFGFISFRNRDLTVISGFDLVFELLNMKARGFLNSILFAGFGVLYYYSCVKAILDIANALKKMKNWLVSSLDSPVTRHTENYCVWTLNNTVWRLFLLCTISHCIYNISLDIWGKLLVVLIFISITVVNAAHFFYRKRDIFESAALSLTRTTVLIGAFIFVFSLFDSNVIDLWNSISKFFSILDIKGVPAYFYIKALLETILVPIVSLWLMLLLLCLAYDAVLEMFSEQSLYYQRELNARSKSLLIKCLVICGAVIIANGYINGYKEADKYLMLLKDNALWIIIPLLMLVAIKGVGSKTADALLYDPVEGMPGMQDDSSDS